jgi:hypothetical protein
MLRKGRELDIMRPPGGYIDCEPCRFVLEDVEGRVEGGDDIQSTIRL